MAGREHQPQQVVADVVVEGGIDVVAAERGVEFAAELLVLAVEHPPAPQQVDRPPFAGRHEPGAGIARDAGAWPFLERGDERVMRQVLGRADIADEPHEPGHQPGGLDAPDGVDGAMGVGLCHDHPSHHPDAGDASRYRPRACISSNPAAAACTSGGKSDISWTCRTSMISWSPIGARLAHSMASSRDRT